MERAVVFAEPSSHISAVLLDAAVRACGGAGIEIVAVVDTARRPTPPYWRRKLRRDAIRAVAEFFDADQRGTRLAAQDSLAVARRHDIPVVVPPERSINHPDFIRRIRDEFRALIGINFGGLQIFRPDLIAAFDILTNVHNSPVPEYRGLRIGEWALFRGETETGCSFHRITPGIDEGPVLLRDSISIPAGIHPAQLEVVKLAHAATRMAEFLQMVRRRDPGTPQSGTPGYFSREDFLRAREIGDPTKKTAAELQFALRCFSILHLELDGRKFPVTKLVPAARHRNRLTFTTADGLAFTPTRFAYLPGFFSERCELFFAWGETHPQ